MLENWLNDRGPRGKSVAIMFGGGDVVFRHMLLAWWTLWISGVRLRYYYVIRRVRLGWNDEILRLELTEFARLELRLPVDGEDWSEFIAQFRFYGMDVNDRSAYQGLKTHVQAQLAAEDCSEYYHSLFYLGTAPALFLPIIDGLASCEWAAPGRGARVISVEKPFGDSPLDAVILNQRLRMAVHNTTTESGLLPLFRLDHYDSKLIAMVLRSFRLAELIQTPGWNAEDVIGIQIIASEDRLLGLRGDTWDAMGQEKDMGSHLWVMARDVLRSVFELSSDEALIALSGMQIQASDVVYGQYVGYATDLGRLETKTDTFVARKAIVPIAGNPLPIYFLSGKALESKQTRAVLMRKGAGPEEIEYLVIQFDPHDVRGFYEVTRGDDGRQIAVDVGSSIVQAQLDGPLGDFSAYARLFHAILHASNDVGLGELESVALQRLLDVMSMQRVAIPDRCLYEVKSSGPPLADMLLPAFASWQIEPIPQLLARSEAARASAS